MMDLRVSGFDWDKGNRAKCEKHGVSIVEIENLFAHSPRVAPDPKHSADEDRLIAVGRTNAGRPVFVAFTIRMKKKIRLIRPVTELALCTTRRLLFMRKKVPRLKTNRQAERFLAQDLSNLDFSQFKPARFEFDRKDEQINMRVPKQLLKAVKARAKMRGIPYTRLIRETLEQAMSAQK